MGFLQRITGKGSNTAFVVNVEHLIRLGDPAKMKEIPLVYHPRAILAGSGDKYAVVGQASQSLVHFVANYKAGLKCVSSIGDLPRGTLIRPYAPDPRIMHSGYKYPFSRKEAEALVRLRNKLFFYLNAPRAGLQIVPGAEILLKQYAYKHLVGLTRSKNQQVICFYEDSDGGYGMGVFGPDSKNDHVYQYILNCPSRHIIVIPYKQRIASPGVPFLPDGRVLYPNDNLTDLRGASLGTVFPGVYAFNVGHTGSVMQQLLNNGKTAYNFVKEVCGGRVPWYGNHDQIVYTEGGHIFVKGTEINSRMTNAQLNAQGMHSIAFRNGRTQLSFHDFLQTLAAGRYPWASMLNDQMFCHNGVRDFNHVYQILTNAGIPVFDGVRNVAGWWPSHDVVMTDHGKVMGICIWVMLPEDGRYNAQAALKQAVGLYSRVAYALAGRNIDLPELGIYRGVI